ncbi:MULTISPECIES: BC_2427 family protein [Lysinibacillus]|uniref:DUF7852 domain-containing protein n=3 Tax=Lysinibacillus TaxID=400634 RepID=B1HUC7_LYSSC|nr:MULTISPECIES: hypothetical protein [Lysinibacillus]ACA41272.1 conserved hypothetical protein [Lysinibacillus sphaericus C3-41]AMO32819.1 hypothetical protein AR327_10415 [Lysinibacillus sphaericus]AMR92077.1 hypothetical protein A1T07_18790 [Lysinibacillus sphaericus]ANA46125.1 hypothetical protein A2J09_11460 [Lysinibacillus sphaericus]EWH33169.1 hypothetical protein P799_14190 [Lysinibacillus sphaericus CBAM5]
MNTPWINFREMREVSTKLNKYSDWAYQTIDDESPANQEESNTLLRDIKDEIRLGEESPDPVASNQDIPSSVETFVEVDNKLQLCSNENPLEDHVLSDLDLAIPKEEFQNSEQHLDKEIALTDLSDANEDLSISTIEGEIEPSPDMKEGTVEESIVTEIVPEPTETTVEDIDEFPSDRDESQVEKQDLAIHSDVESTVEHKWHFERTGNSEKNNPTSKSLDGEIYSITQKCLFSTYVEIHDFLHAPIYGEHVQNTTFEFLNVKDPLTPQLETKLIQTTTDYPEHPECRLVRSDINQLISIMQTDKNDKNNGQHQSFQSVVTPLHHSPSIKKGEATLNESDLIHIRVPVIVGEYKIEICLEEIMAFEKGIVGVKEISNEVVLTNCRFIPIRLSQSFGNGTCTAKYGKLLIEGYIQQSIEYTALDTQNASTTYANQLCQNIVLDLTIHMIQVQKIRVLYDSLYSGQ